MPMLLLKCDSIVQSSIQFLLLLELMGRKLILSNIHLGQLLLKRYLLQLDRLIRKLQTFHHLLDIHLTVLGHVDHPIKQPIDSLLIVLQNVGDLDHVVTVIIE